MAGPRVFLKGTTAWPAQAENLPVASIVKMYEQGFAGAYGEPEEKARFRAEQPQPFGEAIAHASGFAESGAGKLVIPFIYHQQTFPNCWPAAAQDRGDCVSHSTRNALLLTLICEIMAGQPDEVSGVIEGVPEISPEAIKEGVLSTEAIYWWRRHGGDGWSCDAAASVAVKESGMWLRKNYADLGVDLTTYSGSKAGLYGRSTPPATFAAEGQNHLVRNVTELKSFEEARDFLHNGYGVSTCGGEGFSSERNEDGVSKRKGGWSHALAYLGADDRDTTKQKYGEPLVLVQNSWAVWNGGPRRIMGTEFDIPEGSFWARWSDVKNRDMHAFSSANGWPARELPDYGATGRI